MCRLVHRSITLWIAAKYRDVEPSNLVVVPHPLIVMRRRLWGPRMVQGIWFGAKQLLQRLYMQIRYVRSSMLPPNQYYM